MAPLQQSQLKYTRRQILSILAAPVLQCVWEGAIATESQATGQVCNDITSLRRLSGSNDANVRVLGYWRAHDGGGGDFVWNASLDVPDNEGTIIQGASNKGRWVRQGAPARPEWFGARGDGFTDDTLALNSVLMEFREVQLMQGRTYSVSSIACPGWRLIEGNGACITQQILPKVSGQPIMRLLGGNVRIRAVKFIGQRALQPPDGFSDSFDSGRLGTGRAYRAAILGDSHANEVSKIEVTGCFFKEIYGACIALREVNDVTIVGNVAATTNFELVHITGKKASSRIMIAKNHVADVGTGDKIVQSNGMILSFVDDLIVQDNTFSHVERNAIKLEQTCRNVRLSGNRLETNTSDNFAFIQVQSLGLHYAENLTISENYASDVSAGFAFNTARLSNVTLAKNIINGTKGSSMGDGIQLANGSMDHVQITANTIKGIRRYGVVIGQHAESAVIQGITIENNEFALADISGSPQACVVLRVAASSKSQLVKNIRIADNRFSNGARRNNAQKGISIEATVDSGSEISELTITENSFLGDWPTIARFKTSDTIKFYDSHLNLD